MTEDDTSSTYMTNKIAGEQVPDQNNIRESVVTFSDANLGDTASPFGSSLTRTVVVDATQQLEGHRDNTSTSFVPGVNDVTQGVKDVVRNAKSYVRIFRVDNKSFEVNQEQLDRVRMSKCETEDGTGWLVKFVSLGDIASAHAKRSLFFTFFIIMRHSARSIRRRC
jgi:hypothetical protein